MFDPKFIELITDYKNYVKKYNNEIRQILSMRKTTNVYSKDTMRLEKNNYHMYHELHIEFFEYYMDFFHSFKY
jgi:hypothetical protein